MNLKNTFYVTLLSCATLSLQAMETDPLLGRHHNRALQPEQPQPDFVIAPAPRKHRCCNSFIQTWKTLDSEDKGSLGMGAVGTLIADGAGLMCVLGVGGGLGIGFGSVFLVLGGCMKCCGGYYLWKTCRKTTRHNQFVTQANNRLQGAQAKDSMQVTFLFDEMTQLRKHVKVGDITKIKEMIQNTQCLQLDPQLDKQMADNHNRLKTVLLCFKRKGLLRDIQNKIIAQCPKLITGQHIFDRTFAYAYNEGKLNRWLQLFPFQWFCNYCRLQCSNNRKEKLSGTIAQVATDMRLKALCALLPPEIYNQITPEQEGEMRERVCAQYKNRLTTAALPEV